MVELHPEQIPPPGASVESNSMGLASFILSIVGLFTVGTLSLVGLILGIIALRGEPKGFAIAGIVIGVIGLLGGCIILAIMMGLISAGALGIGALAVMASHVDQGKAELHKANTVIAQWHASHDTLPDDQAGDALLKARGIDAHYDLLSNDRYEITLKLDDDTGHPWTFTGTYWNDGKSRSIESFKTGSSSGGSSSKSSDD